MDSYGQTRKGIAEPICKLLIINHSCYSSHHPSPTPFCLNSLILPLDTWTDEIQISRLTPSTSCNHAILLPILLILVFPYPICTSTSPSQSLHTLYFQPLSTYFRWKLSVATDGPSTCPSTLVTREGPEPILWTCPWFLLYSYLHAVPLHILHYPNICFLLFPLPVLLPCPVVTPGTYSSTGVA